MGVDFRQVDLSLSETVPDVEQTAAWGVSGLVHDYTGLAWKNDDGFGKVGVGWTESMGWGRAVIGSFRAAVVGLQVVLALLLAETLLEFALQSTLLFARSQQLIQHAIIMRVKN
jgi:hypothetical protein